jgi:hypothetical protein
MPAPELCLDQQPEPLAPNQPVAIPALAARWQAKMFGSHLIQTQPVIDVTGTGHELLYSLPSHPQFFPSFSSLRAMNQPATNSGETREVSQVVEHLFRHESGKMVATLTRIFGIEHLSLVEDVVQECARCRRGRFTESPGIPPRGSCGVRETSRWTLSGAKRFSATRKPKSSG